jgi:hypothetical protein
MWTAPLERQNQPRKGLRRSWKWRWARDKSGWSCGIGKMGWAGSREWRSVEWFATLRQLMLRR